MTMLLIYRQVSLIKPYLSLDSYSIFMIKGFVELIHASFAMTTDEQHKNYHFIIIQNILKLFIT